MNFDTIDPSLSPGQVELAKRKFSQLLCYLAIRSDNYHVCGNKGGNNFQLLLLAEYTHHLVSETFGVCRFRLRPRMEWSADYLISSSLDKIREDVDFVFGTVKSNNYALSMLFTNLNGNGLRESCKYSLVPNLATVVDKPSVSGALSLTWQEKLILACIICDDIARQVDKVPACPIDEGAVKVMDIMPPEIVIFSVRTRVGIDRLIRSSLDEHPTFGPILMKINNLVPDP